MDLLRTNEFREWWAEYVRTNPNWKKIHTQFINNYFEQRYRWTELILKDAKGKKVLRELYGIRNRKGYPSYF